MKTKFILSMLCIAIFFTACGDKQEIITPAADMVEGVYSGMLNVNGTNYSNIEVRAIRVSDTEVSLQSTSANEGFTSQFAADLKLRDEGVILTVNTQSIGNGDELYGNDNLYPQNRTYHGAYDPDNEQLSYSIILNINGAELVESFQGYKK